LAISATDSARIRDKLIKLREELQDVAATSDQSSQVVELDQSRVGRLSRMDAMQAQAMAQASGERRETRLRDIEAALQRIECGNYGNCRCCDEPINARRLECDPAVTLCMSCAERAEQSA